LRFCLSAVYATVFFLGLALALWAVDFLLGIKVHTNLYPELWICSVFVVQTWYFLAGVPQPLSELEKREDYPAGLKIFTQYLLVPLVSIYTIILYAYMGKILFKWIWPKGMVTWLVSGVSVFGVLTLLLVYPVQERKENRWIKVFSCAFYLALFPLLVMLLVAAGKRISQYGITEQRYFVVVLALWISAIAVYFLVSRIRNIKVVPITLCLVALATSFGPWGAYGVSVRSQIRRLERIFEKNGMLVGGKARRVTHAMEWNDKKEMSSLLYYLIENHGVFSVQRLFEGDLSSYEKSSRRNRNWAYAATEILKPLGVTYIPPWESQPQSNSFHFSRSSQRLPLDIRTYDYLVESNFSMFLLDGQSYFCRLTEAKLQILKDQTLVLDFDLSKMIQKLKESSPSNNRYDLSPNQMEVETESDFFKGKLYLNEINGEEEKGQVRLTSGSGLLLLKKK
jgi:uncharacterized protein DUF4153